MKKKVTVLLNSENNKSPFLKDLGDDSSSLAFLCMAPTKAMKLVKFFPMICSVL